MEDSMYTMNELSQYLKIPKSTIYKLAEYNDLPSCKIGKQLRFRKSSIDNWLSQKEFRHRRGQGFKLGESKYILLVDDDRLLLKAVARLLKMHGYNVESAQSGQEALDRIKRLRFDLIIADMRMPGIDGIETIKRIREFYNSNNIPLAPEIIITGYTDPVIEEEAESLGIKDYVYKPFTNLEFLKTVESRLKPVTALPAAPAN